MTDGSATITIDLAVAGSSQDMSDECALAGLRVLLVDDDDDIRDAFQLVLERYGAAVTPAGSAAEARAALGTSTPDVLLTDLAMPGENGYELMQHVTALPHPPPAAALTAYATTEGAEQSRRSGFRLYLAKPLDAAGLVEAVAVLAGRLAPRR